MRKVFLAGMIITLCSSIFTKGQNLLRDRKKETIEADSVQNGILYLKKFLDSSGPWKIENPVLQKSINGLIHFAEDEKIDSVLIRLNRLQRYGQDNYVVRNPLLIPDSLSVPGYQPYAKILENMKQLDRQIWNGVDLNSIPVPDELITNVVRKLPLLKQGDYTVLIQKRLVRMPDSLKNAGAVADSLMRTPKDLARARRLDSLRTSIFEAARLRYNEQMIKYITDSVKLDYRQYAVRVYSDSLQNHLKDSLQNLNKQRLTAYNTQIVTQVNDSIRRYVNILRKLAERDSVALWVHNLTNDSTQVWLRNNKRTYSRMFIKNEQNDSLGVKFMNLSKNSIRMMIDDGVTFQRISQRQRRDFDFNQFNSPKKNLEQINSRYKIVTPWTLAGNGNFGFTQTYLNNWKKGGKSSLAFLTVLKGSANYSQGKVKWENSAEIRSGWIRQGGDSIIQKNDDKFEVISRVGYSAFKKWYYSSEIDFETQLFNGYNYPNTKTPISGFLSPATTTIKVGLDYKPNNNFSLFISPLTAKSIFVRDTARIDQTKYGIDKDKRTYWKPGLNADLSYKKNFGTNLTYETKYKMFINYTKLSSFDVNWENTLTAKLTNVINMTMMLNMIYDDDVTFATNRVDSNGKTIYKPKWQTKELITIGFTYKLNKNVYRRKDVN